MSPNDNAGKWQAKWIWESQTTPEKNAYAYFRRTFDLNEVPASMLARVTADSRYHLYVNRKDVERGPARCEPDYQSYDEIDIAPYLTKGKNVIAVLVHFIGTSTAFYTPGKPGFFLDCGDLSTDAMWKAIPAADYKLELSQQMGGQLEFNEIKDAANTPVDWCEADFDDSAWPNVLAVGEAGTEPWTRLVPSELEPQRRVLMPAEGYREMGIWKQNAAEDAQDLSALVAHRRRWPLPLSEDACKQGESDERGVLPRSLDLNTKPIPADGLQVNPGEFVVFDMGQIISGNVVFELTAESGQILDVREGEYPMGYGGPIQVWPTVDRYIARDGRQRWETFEKRGFRYLTVDVSGGGKPVTIHFAGGRFGSYPVKWREFCCSDARLNEICRLSAYTVQLNMEDAFTDCQWRERGQWLGDGRVEVLENFYCFGDTDLTRRFIKQMARSQMPNGQIRAFVPTRNEFYIPTWSLCFPLTARDYYLFTGDTELLKEVYPQIKKSVEFYDERRDKGLLRKGDDWVFIDWTPVHIGDANAALNAFYYGALVAVAEIAKAIGDTEGLAEYEKRAKETKEAFNAELWDEERKAYVDSISDGKQSPAIGQPANCLAIHYGVADDDKVQIVMDNIFGTNVTLPFHWTHLGLVDFEKFRGLVIPSGSPYMSFYVLNAIRLAGRHDKALDYIREWWGIMLEEGDTATREMWEIQTGDLSSRAHGWSAAPAYDLPAYVLGVRPLEPGWKKIVIEPQLSGLKWARGIIPVIGKELEVTVREKDGVISAEGKLPEGFEAIVRLPGQEDKTVSGSWHL